VSGGGTAPASPHRIASTPRAAMVAYRIELVPDMTIPPVDHRPRGIAAGVGSHGDCDGLRLRTSQGHVCLLAHIAAIRVLRLVTAMGRLHPFELRTSGDSDQEEMYQVACLEREGVALATLSLTLAKGKAILKAHPGGDG